VNQLLFITAVPLDVRRGSGCYVGTRTLVEALRHLGASVAIVKPWITSPIYVATRILFNESLRWRHFDADVTVGIDADGYANEVGKKSRPHVACIKGVLGDAVPFESGGTRLSMSLQARLEARHARRADLLITVSNYCAQRLEELYGVRGAVVVPELIDLNAWRHLFRASPAGSDRDKFTILSVCRFYPRKRLEILLRAVALVRRMTPELEVRIVGNGPEFGKLSNICADLRLEPIVRWLGDLSLAELAAEYKRSHVFCLPSVQEGFGIVFLEAMAAGKPIVAARAAAIPEVVRNGILVERDNPEMLAEALFRLYRDPDLRRDLGTAGLRDVEQFEMHRVAIRFLTEVAKVAPGIAVPERFEYGN
jgi:glycosyltransferase involved in cell wall biosynthesis